MTQPKTSIGREFQDTTLGRLAERGQVTTIYLRNRMSLRGRILDFDPYVLILEPLDGSPPQLVYKSAIVSVAGPPRRGRPYGPPRYGDEGGGRGPDSPHASAEQGGPASDADSGPAPTDEDTTSAS